MGHRRPRLAGRARGKLYLIHLIDVATTPLLGRFARSDSTEENIRLLWTYLRSNGRPLAFYTDKASSIPHNTEGGWSSRRRTR